MNIISCTSFPALSLGVSLGGGVGGGGWEEVGGGGGGGSCSI